MNVINYQKELDKTIVSLQKEGRVPKLLLHSCCAPCSSYVLEYLSEYFEITVFYYNPNIYPESEYTKRILEQQELISLMNLKHPVSFLAGNYDKERFYRMAEGVGEVQKESCRQRGWKMSKRAAPDALNVMRSGFGRRHRWQKKPVMIILRPHFLSVL